MFKTAKAKKRRFSDVLNVFKRFSNNSKTPPSKIEHKNEIARKTEDFLIFRAIFLTLQFLFTFLFLSHSTQNITHFRRFLPLPIQFHPFPPFSTFLRFPCQLTINNTLFITFSKDYTFSLVEIDVLPVQKHHFSHTHSGRCEHIYHR